jgi:hypothetical protein
MNYKLGMLTLKNNSTNTSKPQRQTKRENTINRSLSKTPASKTNNMFLNISNKSYAKISKIVKIDETNKRSKIQ